ncbi:MAG: SDR family NAD(P)-dependent oxidoreductase [Firmicutes bacterium]|nr:SDR family NAD(P)-dependent oxidoreductase [Bacillota bacterium]MBQ2536323.1 SDR family NAD(P)-dependent oxidoreductase [Bacteroidaceae bacterium]
MGKTWIITGASAGGIGEGIARAVLAKGDNAVITARSLSKLEGIAQDYPDTCLPFALDICSQEAIKACVKAAVDKFGTVDVLINNAGHGYRSSVEEGEEAAIRELYETNLFGPIHMIKEVLPIMRAKGSGAILNTTSIAAERSAIGSGYYASSKAALDLLTDGLCKELKPLGIRVMVIEPGSFRTHFYDEALKSAPLTVEAYKDSTWKNANAVNKRQQPGDPMKAGEVIVKMAEAEEAPFRLLLGSDAVKAVTSTAEGRIEEALKFAQISESTNY